MTMERRLASLAALSTMAWIGAVHAHHSFSIFDMETEKVIDGEVVEFVPRRAHGNALLATPTEDAQHGLALRDG